MKKLTALFFAAAMMFSIVFIGDALSSSGSMSVNAQTVTSRKTRRRGIGHRTYRGGRWVVVRTWRGGKWVTRKVYKGGKMVTRKTTRGTKRVYRVTRHGGVRVYRKVVRAVN